MGSSEHNRSNISSLIGGKMLNLSMEVFFYLAFSEYYNQISNFTNQMFVTLSL